MCHLWMSRKTQNEYRLHVQTDNYLSYRSFIASPMTKKHMPDWISDRHCQNNSFTHRRVLWCRTAWGSVIQILNSLTEQYLIQRIHIRWNPLDAMSWERLASLPQKILLALCSGRSSIEGSLTGVSSSPSLKQQSNIKGCLLSLTIERWSMNSLRCFLGFKIVFAHSVAQYVSRCLQCHRIKQTDST